MKARKAIKTFFATLFAAVVVLSSGSISDSLAIADDLTAFDRTAIEEDLKDVDLSEYPKVADGRHSLLDEIGFVEYGYSNNSSVAGKYYGIYFYLYNPTEKEVSLRSGANVVNLAVSYDEKGEPVNYANIPLTVLDHTDNYRFYKLRISDASAVYAREQVYAAEHGGERRYDLAGIQLWFAGEQNATDEYAGQSELGRTFLCSGYAEGFGSTTSTLKVSYKNLETVQLDVNHTFYRTNTSSLGIGHQNQIDSVYFSVPNRYFEEYGKLQRIKAEWWEYKTKPFVVTSSSDFYYAALPYMGVDMTELNEAHFSSEVGYSLFPATSEIFPYFGDKGWNVPIWGQVLETGRKYYLSQAREQAGAWIREEDADEIIPALYAIFPTKNWCDIEDYDPYLDVEEIGGVTQSALERYIFSYDNSFQNGTLECKEGQVSADLFESDIDENRKIDNEQGKIQFGYSYYDFDADTDLQEILAYQPSDNSFGKNVQMYGFWKTLFGTYQDLVEADETLSPILIIKQSDLGGTDTEISERLKVNISDVAKIKEEYTRAERDNQTVVLFRFAVSDYYSQKMSFAQVTLGEPTVKRMPFGEPDYGILPQTTDLLIYPRSVEPSVGREKAYLAQESVFLNFDVIQLTFNNNGDMKILPVVASPIDIIDPLTPPVNLKGSSDVNFIYAMVVLIVVLVIGLIVSLIIQRARKNREGNASFESENISKEKKKRNCRRE